MSSLFIPSELNASLRELKRHLESFSYVSLDFSRSLFIEKMRSGVNDEVFGSVPFAQDDSFVEWINSTNYVSVKLLSFTLGDSTSLKVLSLSPACRYDSFTEWNQKTLDFQSVTNIRVKLLKKRINSLLFPNKEIGGVVASTALLCRMYSELYLPHTSDGAHANSFANIKDLEEQDLTEANLAKLPDMLDEMSVPVPISPGCVYLQEKGNTGKVGIQVDIKTLVFNVNTPVICSDIRWIIGV
jgi:hypothetical protein